MTHKDYDDRMGFSPLSPDSEREEELFVLLSCYLDGEVTPEERQEAERLLATDAQAQAIYERLSCVSSGLQLMPTPPSHDAPEAVVDGVFARMRQRRRQRLAWGGTAIAALFVAAVSGVQLNFEATSPQIAQSPAPVRIEGDAKFTEKSPVPTKSPVAETLEAQALFVE
jgi:anti-sigma factor RsiW